MGQGGCEGDSLMSPVGLLRGGLARDFARGGGGPPAGWLAFLHVPSPIFPKLEVSHEEALSVQGTEDG